MPVATYPNSRPTRAPIAPTDEGVEPLAVAALDGPEDVALAEREPDGHAQEGQEDRLAAPEEVAHEQQRDADAHREAAEVGLSHPARSADAGEDQLHAGPGC